MSIKCAVQGCNYSWSNNPRGVYFHRFPTEKKYMKIWINATGKTNYTPDTFSKICSAHFADTAYRSDKNLKPDAVPTIGVTVCEPKKRKSDASANKSGGVMAASTETVPGELVDPASEPPTQQDPPSPADSATAGCATPTQPDTVATEDSPTQPDTVATEGSPTQPDTVATEDSPTQPDTVATEGSPTQPVNSPGEAAAEDPDPEAPEKPANTPEETSADLVERTKSDDTSTAAAEASRDSVAPKESEDPSSKTADGSSDGEEATESDDTPATRVAAEADMKAGCGGSTEADNTSAEAAVVSTGPEPSVNTATDSTQPDNTPSAAGCPIKVVDVKKLMPNSPQEDDPKSLAQPCTKTGDPELSNEDQDDDSECEDDPDDVNDDGGDANSPDFQEEKKVSVVESGCEVMPTIKISDVLDCLAVILPKNFDMSRLMPNDKIAALIIRFLKFPESQSAINQVKENLQIILKGYAIKEVRHASGMSSHPYHNITDAELQVALTRVFPVNFSMINVTIEILKCLCILLDKPFYGDGDHILRMQIRKFTSEGQMFNNIINQRAIKRERHTSTAEVPNKRQKEDTSEDRDWSPNMEEMDADSDWSPVAVILGHKTTVRIDSRKTSIYVENILNYIEQNKCSAKDVLSNFKLMFYLCKILHVNTRRDESGLKKLKMALKMIAQYNINKANFKQYVFSMHQMLYPCKTKVPGVSGKQKPFVDKLKLQPVVVLHNIADYSKERLSFMTEKKTINDGFSRRPPVPFPLSNIPLTKYSADYVRKITHESFKVFRKIVIKKRENNTAVFRVKYSELAPWSEVFVKDFSNPDLGWMKAVVLSSKRNCKYTLQLENGKSMDCAAEQLRPLPSSALQASSLTPPTPRSQRQIKPKQLFDL